MGSYRSRSIYQLEEIEPAIWRRISVPGKISLARLHRLLQLAMGWENYHLHMFTIGEVRYGEPDPEYADEGTQIKHDRHALVRDVLRTEGMRFRYDYDFGDDWRHNVLVEHIELFDKETGWHHDVSTAGGLARQKTAVVSRDTTNCSKPSATLTTTIMSACVPG